MLSQLTTTDVGRLCAFLTGREKCGLGLAEDLKQVRILFGSSRLKILWMKSVFDTPQKW